MAIADTQNRQRRQILVSELDPIAVDAESAFEVSSVVARPDHDRRDTGDCSGSQPPRRCVLRGQRHGRGPLSAVIVTFEPKDQGRMPDERGRRVTAHHEIDPCRPDAMEVDRAPLKRGCDKRIRVSTENRHGHEVGLIAPRREMARRPGCPIRVPFLKWAPREAERDCSLPGHVRTMTSRAWELRTRGA